jgi:hypothetical protein
MFGATTRPGPHDLELAEARDDAQWRSGGDKERAAGVEALVEALMSWPKLKGPKP